MKFFYPVILLLAFTSASAQDVIYSPTGDKTPAKITNIQADKIKYKNPANLTGPDYSKSLSKVLIAFNSAGSYIIFNDKTTVADDEKNIFVNEVPSPRSTDIVVDAKGVVYNMAIKDEKDAYIAGVYKSKTLKLLKPSLVFVIRKNGTHQLFVSTDKAAAYLANAKAKINQLINGTTPENAPANPAVAAITTVKTPATATGDDMAVDMKLFSKKALQKTEDFSNYLSAICSVNTDRDLSTKSINLACGLFVSEEAKVEVSSINNKVKPTYKIRAYLNRLQLRSGQYDKVTIEYADINYASKFTKGADGNYYATITFVQKFKGFIDNKVVYGDKTKRNITVVLKTYEKAVDGQMQSGWDVFLENMGVVETKKV